MGSDNHLLGYFFATLSCLSICNPQTIHVLIEQESKKFKRLKKAQRDHHSGRGVRTAEEMLHHSLFGDGKCKLCEHK